ncbi:unnamed protein product [Phyllotreta striolata]|uniref:Cytochrome P450 n=1 Tax=Phyllotreta striolata TaxID=444603 RepID=A0A9N9XMR6_PHYSR|nr:unnamed protein product [Phyllotreta striolata]
MIGAYLFYGVLSLAASVYLYFKWKHSYWKRKNVDYIEPEFLFGNTGDVLKKKEHKSTLYKKYYEHFKSRGQKFGGLYDFQRPVLMVTDLELARNVIQKDFSHFVNHVAFLNEENDPLSGNLFNLRDEKWKNIRALLTPTFSSGKIKMMFETMVKTTEGFEKLLDKSAKINEPVNIGPQLLLFTTDIIASVAFGIEANCMENPDSDFRKVFTNVLGSSPLQLIKLIIALSLPKWLLVLLKVRLADQKIGNFFTKVVTDIVEYREKNKVFRKDFMHLLIQLKNMGELEDGENLTNSTTKKHLSIPEMTAHAVTFYVAGFETSSSTMSFVMLELALHQDIQDRLREEIHSVIKKYDGKITYDGVMEMEYLNMVLQESMRKNSVAANLSRNCNKAYKIPGTDVVIDPDTEVIIPVLGFHWDPEYYPEPEKFDPERFSPENKHKIPNYAYLPFGDGPRSCIGLRFGKIQSLLGICFIVSKYRITLNNKTQLPVELDLSKRIPAVRGGVWLDLEKL